MKRIILLLTLCLALVAPLSFIQADSSWSLEDITLEEVKAKIKAKEELYLFIGRPEHVHTQLGIERLADAPKPVYYLNTKGIDAVAYKKFARKYNIRTAAYLGHFKNRRQVQHIPNVGMVDQADLEGFFAAYP
ncbi:hypothetical protein ACVR1I_05530 [Streptococcus cameli]